MKKRFLPLLLFAVLILVGCRSDSRLTGVWETVSYSEELQGNVTLRYRFAKDGQLFTEGDGYSLSLGSYRVKGDVLTITGDDDAKSEFTFSVQDDTLTLFGADGAVYATFTRVKDA